MPHEAYLTIKAFKENKITFWASLVRYSWPERKYRKQAELRQIFL